MAAILKPLLLLIFLSTPLTAALNSSSPTSNNTHLHSLCRAAPYPAACFDSLALFLSINLPPNILTFLLQTLRTAVSQALTLSDLLSAAAANLPETHRGPILDCTELHQITLSALRNSVSRVVSGKGFSDARVFLSAALTNRATCLEGLETAGPPDPSLADSIARAYAHVSNSLSMISTPGFPAGGKRRLLGSLRRLLQEEEYPSGEAITVAADGGGNFTTVSEAIDFAPNNSAERVIIHITAGIYPENVEIPSWKTNIVLIGDGSDVTVITGNRSMADGWTTFRSATVAVSGEGFLARDLTFENTAGPAKHQAVALRINADLAAVYRCAVVGYQDTLYTHSFRQFFRECDIYGTIDFICGNAAVVFQNCNVVSRMPMPGQGTVITAQSRDSPDMVTGISLQNCSILADDELQANSSVVKSFLGRPWRNYSRTVILESYIDSFIESEGWSGWNGDNQGLDTLYYGEYENYGPGSGLDGRVSWDGYHVMDYDDASNFTVSWLLDGEEWLGSTSFPYDDWM